MSEFLSALNASPEKYFVHKVLKDEQVECIQRIVCHGRDVLTVLPTRLAKSTIYQLIPKVLFRLGRTANATSKTTAELLVFLLAYKVERYLHQVLLLKLTHYEQNMRTCFTK